MKVEDMIENYLLSMGQKINLEKYSFIPKRDYDYKSKIKEETLKIGKYKVELTKVNRNSKELGNIFYNARTNFNNNVSVSEDVGASCKNIVNNAINYFTDFLKYAYNNFDLTPEIAEKFITLCNGAIDTLGRNIQSTLAEYDIKMAEAQRQGAMDAQNSLASSLADIESKKSTYVTMDTYHDPIMGDRAVGYVSHGFADKAMHEGMLAGARQAASIIGSIPVEIASKEAVEGLKKLRNKTVSDFNSNFEDLVAAKIKKLIDTDIIDKNGKDLNDNSTIYSHYYSIVKDLKEEDLENFSKAIKFYNFDIKDQVTSDALESVTSYYNKNNSFDYKGGDALLAIYLNDDQYLYRKEISESILQTIKNKLQKAKKEEIDKVLESLLEPIQSCKYIKDEDIKRIQKEGKEIAETTISNKIKETKDNRIILLLNIISSILIVVLAVTSFCVGIKFWYIIIESGLLLLVVSPAIIICFIKLFIKNCKIKNKALKIGIIIIAAILSIYGTITINNINKFREGKVLISYYHSGEDTFKWTEKGTPIDITFPEEFIGDETAQGWTDKKGYFILEGTLANEYTELEFNEATGTPANGLATVTFKLGNGQKDFSYKQYIGSWIDLPQNPVKEGYEFTGWVTGKKKTPVIHRQTILEKNMTVTATYKKISK